MAVTSSYQLRARLKHCAECCKAVKDKDDRRKRIASGPEPEPRQSSIGVEQPARPVQNPPQR